MSEWLQDRYLVVPTKGSQRPKDLGTPGQLAGLVECARRCSEALQLVACRWATGGTTWKDKVSGASSYALHTVLNIYLPTAACTPARARCPVRATPHTR
jgi:hypothetical protein